MVGCADATYATHADVGFESDRSCWVALISGKQSIVAKSTGEAELIAQNKVGDMIKWLIQLMEELRYPQATVLMYADRTCTMNMLKNGTGLFKRAKHIKVQYFW